jgi:hypothetical protein
MIHLLATVPLPPYNFKASSAQDVFSIAQIVVFGVMLAFAVREIARGRGVGGSVFLYCLIGGAIAVIWEPIVDVLGQCWLPARGQHWEAFTLLGRHVPLMMPFVYAWFVGGQGYLFYRIFQHGIDRRQVFQLWGAVFVVNILLESPGVIAGVYTYYGKQPFDIWGFPLWWGFINPLMPMIAGALIYKLRPHLSGAGEALAIVAIIPMADGVANAAAGWPVIAALNTDVGYVGTWIASLITLGLAAFIVWIVGLVVATPVPVLATAEAPVAAANGSSRVGQPPAIAGV